MEIATANGTQDEARVRDLLLQLLDRYDTRRWHFTDKMVIDENATPHSHPVLTLTTRMLGRSPMGLLSSFLHEQLHWYVQARGDDGLRAIDDVRALFPNAPAHDQGGARDEFSTYLHLMVNWLELESLRQVVGREEADKLLRSTVDGPVYGWIYRQVFDRHDDIGGVVRRHGLDRILSAER